MQLTFETTGKIEKADVYKALIFDAYMDKGKVRVEVREEKSGETFGLTYDPIIAPGSGLYDMLEKVLGPDFKYDPQGIFNMSQIKSKPCKIVIQRRSRGEGKHSFVPSLLLNP